MHWVDVVRWGSYGEYWCVLCWEDGVDYSLVLYTPISPVDELEV